MRTPETIIIVLLGIIIFMMFIKPRMSGFQRLSPMPISIQGTNNEPSDFWNLPLSMKGVPGPSKDAEYYVTDSPGAVMGGSKFVNEQIKNYKIV
jgi:hypothetical protein